MTAAQFRETGIDVVPSGLGPADLAALAGLVDRHVGAGPGARLKPSDPALDLLLGSEGVLRRLADHLMGAPMRPVRVLCFDKTAEANWAVP